MHAMKLSINIYVQMMPSHNTYTHQSKNNLYRLLRYQNSWIALLSYNVSTRTFIME